ncbi:CinA family protein [Absiella sp. AM29-15]|uniref:CinA family protein n=1 Tax=Absiella sp. AM29-15 TaxID=2292278 RepID=UPI000E42AC0F|nr:CinA family protein [Absiella sp. AM29-15]RGC45949.1 CinA family protein [Absiella sp. AM29-15]
MQELIALLKAKNLTIGSCESFTAGLFCASLASVSGASAVLKGGVVTYATCIKTDVVHVDKNIVDTYGVISKECAIEMAKKAQQLLDVDICVSFTGNAGPSAMEGKPAGEVYCAIAYHDDVIAYQLQIQEERNKVREEAVRFMCQKLCERLS